MKQTPFTKYHIANGAKMVEFAGYNMPIEFTGINDEHMTVRERAGVFDVSHMGEIWVTGPRAVELLQTITSNDVGALRDGKVQYTALLNERGGIVDDVLVYRFDAEKYLLVVNAANTDKDWGHIVEQGARFGLTPGAGLKNASDEWAQLAVQGPDAMKIVQKLAGEPVETMEYYTFKTMPVAGIDSAILSITGYTGSGGCEIYVPTAEADKLWAALWEAGRDAGLKNIGLGARDTLRLEACFTLYGNELDKHTTPIEAGLGWITKFIDGKAFHGRELMERQKTGALDRRLAAFEMSERAIPRHGYKIVDSAGAEIGVVTSGTMSPMHKKGIGMGYVRPESAKPDAEIFVVIRDKPAAARVIKGSFLKTRARIL
ncbi:MAG: glycine cleavage system aminomethyltransferase GcvT [Rikenellaceae bacterium]|nr:glycine cleavage system aminomethyltransferase GcvT [Rikenellaceae bacterium]MCL2692301.1 glycine cleavage system aminomethyltransferase GcvT [Rikenellaceae bacterium]